MQDFLRAHRSAAAAAMFAVLASVLAWMSGQDLNWDLLNYHYYNGWAWLNDRLAVDIAPAQLQSYFNPLLDVPLYLALRTLPAWLVAAVYASVQSIDCWLVWNIARVTLPDAHRERWALGLALMTLGGAIFRAELGGGMGDSLVSIPILLALWLLLARAERIATLPARQAAAWIVAGGLCAGIAGGLKLVVLIFAIGFGLTTALLAQSPRQRWQFPLCFGVGAGVGCLLVAGPWWWQVWHTFGNPLFPLFNDVFASPLAPATSLRDTRFLPGNLWQALTYPLYWMFNPRAVSDVGHFRDLRLPLLYLLGLAWLILRLRRRTPALARPARFLMAGMLLSYVLWLGVFGIYRYLVVLELLAPLALVLLAQTLNWRARAIVPVLLLAALSVLPLRLGRAPWSVPTSGFGADGPLPRTSGAVVVLGGMAPSAFLLPALGEGNRYIRLSSNFQDPSATPAGLALRARAALAAPGPSFELVYAAEAHTMDATLADYALRRDADSCIRITTAAAATRPEALLPQPFLWCRLIRE